MPSFAYPVSLEVGGRKAVVIGTVAVALGKADGLLDASAEVMVIATAPADTLDALAARGAHIERRGYLPGDLADAFLCVASDPDDEVRDAIRAEAAAERTLLNMVDDVARCDWAAPAVVRRGDLVLAISTGGRSPSLARRLREQLGEAFGPEWGQALDVLADVRAATLPMLPDFEDRAERWSRALDTGELTRLIREDRADEARERLTARLLADPGHGGTAAEPGTVHLVGAGPGDPDLVTLRGAEALRSADVVIYDRLAPEALLDLAPPEAERIFAGKAPGAAVLDQEAINAAMIQHARAGRTVVRLKGGDPFVFGRGGEEALACVEAGIPFEVVPGVSAAVAAPAFAGIPVTHRDVAASFAVVTASRRDDSLEQLARIGTAVDTVVVLMTAGRLDPVCRALIGAGRPASEPAALVEWASTPQQRSIVSTLEHVAPHAERAGIGSPATLVVGQVAALAWDLAWFREQGVVDPMDAGAANPVAEHLAE